MTRDEIIAKNPLLAYCEAHGWKMRRAGAEWNCLCPLHDEKTPSFFVNPEKQVWHCHGCKRGGSVIDLHMGLHGFDEGEAMADLSNGHRDRNHDHQPPPKREVDDPFRDEKKAADRAKWPTFEVPTKKEIKTIAELRGLSEEGISLAVDAGLLFCAKWYGRRAWVVTDSRRVNAQARCMDGEHWARIDKKAQSLPGSVGDWPIGLREAQQYGAIALVEGGPDLLAAFHLSYIANQEANVAPVAMLGSMPISEQALPLFANKRVRLFGHYDDKAGAISETTRGTQLRKAGARVDRYDLGGFKTSNGTPVKDLCDFCHVGVDQWEQDREAIDAAFVIE